VWGGMPCNGINGKERPYDQAFFYYIPDAKVILDSEFRGHRGGDTAKAGELSNRVITVVCQKQFCNV